MSKPKIETSPPEVWKKLKPIARSLRHEPTEAEDRLWQVLRGGALGAKFRRQHAIRHYVVDFYCPSASLVVEVDGPIHEYRLKQDAARDRELKEKGYQVLRLSNDHVLSAIEEALAEISMYLAPHPPASSPQGEGAN